MKIKDKFYENNLIDRLVLEPFSEEELNVPWKLNSAADWYIPIEQLMIEFEGTRFFFEGLSSRNIRIPREAFDRRYTYQSLIVTPKSKYYNEVANIVKNGE